MTFVLPSDADPAPVTPTPVPSSRPDFLSQLSAAQQADARLNSRGHELTDQEFLGGGQPTGTRGATPDLSHVSDADLQAIAAQGSSGATGRWSDAPLAHQWSNAPLAQAPGRNFDDVDKAFSRPTPFRLLSDADELSDEQFLVTPAPVGPDVAKSAASGISSGVQGLIGMGGDIRHAADYGMLWAEAKIAEKLGNLPPGQTADDVIAKYHGSAGRAFMASAYPTLRPTSWALAHRARPM